MPTASEIRQAGRGITSEPAAIWTLRDELQQRLVQQSRRLPYELPALYIGQRAVVDPLFGNNQDRKKVNWYNPVDVLADFAKQSVTNIVSITGTGAVGGAALARSKFLANAPYASNPHLSLTANQLTAANKFADLKVVLGEVGQDLGKLINLGTKYSSSASGAFNLAVEEAGRSQSSPVFAMQAARKGMEKAAEAASNANLGKNRVALAKAKAFFLGFDSGDHKYLGALDTVPSLRGFTTGARTFTEKFRNMKEGYDVVSGAKSFDEAVNRVKLGPNKTATQQLEEAIRVVQGQHKSKFSAFADSVGRAMGKGGPADTSVSRDSFARAVQESEYRKQLRNYLINNGSSKESAENFMKEVNVRAIPTTSKNFQSVTQRLSWSKKNFVAETDDDFYQQMIKRFRKQNGLADQSLNESVLQKAIRDTDAVMTSKEFQKQLAHKTQKNWNAFYNQVAVPYGNTILKPQKAVYQEFVGPLTAAKEDFLRRRTAQVLGVNLRNADGRLVSTQIINSELGKRGIDANNFGQLRGFLIKNKAMTSQANSGGFNLFGMKQLLVDEAFDKGVFNYLEPNQKDLVRDLAGRLKLGDPVSKSIGFSRLDGVYQNRNGEVVDLTRIKSMVTGIGNFFANEFQIPIVKFNPLQMLGVGGPTGVSASAPFHFAPGSSMQPFGKIESHASDVFVWTKAKGGIFGAKGTLTSIGQDVSGNVKSTQLEGLYRTLSPKDSNIFSRAASYAANRGAALRTAELEAAQAGKELSFSERVKKAFDIDEEQPNSLFRLGQRFAKRKSDINNPNVFGRLLAEDTIEAGSKRSRKTLSLRSNQNGKFSVVNETGAEVYGHKQVLEAYDQFRRTTMEYGTPLKVMKEVEAKIQSRFGDVMSLNISGTKMTPSQLSTASEMNEFSRAIMDQLSSDKAILRARGVDTSGLTRASSRVAKMIDDDNLNAVSAMSARSPAVSSRLDEYRNEIYRYMVERQTYMTAKGDPGSLLTAMDEAINDLRKRGLISAGQVAEARAAGLSTFFNINAFRTFSTQATTGNNASNALANSMSIVRGTARGAYRNMASPFTEGTASIIDTSGLKKATSLIKPAFSKKFGTAAYQIDELTGNPLGAGSKTFVPTAATSIKSVGMKRFLMSSLGITTYSDPAAFSFSSVPISHGFERLNRYFGTLGLGLDPNKYKGPVDLYMRGMVGKRVLPIVAGGTAALTIDRTIGGFVNEKDQRGERVYSPFFLGKAARGVVEGQAAIAGIVPGGMGYGEKKEQLLEGEVPIRQGRFWPLGTTPFEGGKVMYYRPSWYRKMQAGAMYTSDSFGSPVEKFLYGYDYSPLRPLDPYRFERKHYQDRPYPVTGEYFSGPFGPVTSALNMTVGKILKPQLKMHEQEVSENLSQYVPAGESGAYNPEGLLASGRVAINYNLSGTTPSRTQQIGSGFVVGNQNSQISSYNQYLSAKSGSLSTARNATMRTIAAQNSRYVQSSQFGPPQIPGTVAPGIIAAGTPISHANLNLQAGEFGYRMQETAGIYGFGFASVRESLGFGSSDFEPQRSVLQSASKAYGTTRAFWDLNLGGLGDVPLTAEGALGNIEISEIVRRFIPKERTNVNYLNPIANTMGRQHPFLPGSDYFINFKQGDPFAKVPEGELRLPGVAYERLNPTMRGYDDLTKLDILADVAPYSKEFRQLNRTITASSLEPGQRQKLEEIRSQVEQTTKKYEFANYKYKNSSAKELGIDQKGYFLGRMGEYIAHRDTYFNTKFLQKRTAQEDWERRNVYGATFPEWQKPVESFIQPMLNKATQRNPIAAGIGLSIVGSMFGKTARARAFGAISGLVAGASYSSYGNIKEAVTGERFIPKERKKQLALEEYSDILNYVKSTSLASQAAQQGDMASAAQFKQAAKRTMYGADIYGASVDTLSLAIPKRKREHFKAMIQETDSQERERILSTSGRLERRIYQAAWGMKVEERPDLVDYFERHELPGNSWEGWHPNTNMEHVKIKMGQSMGIEMSQMGYYPQQVREANLTGPSYPSFGQGQKNQNVAAQLRQLMSRNGINGSVVPVMNQYGGSSVDISAGLVRN